MLLIVCLYYEWMENGICVYLCVHVYPGALHCAYSHMCTVIYVNMYGYKLIMKLQTT